MSYTPFKMKGPAMQYGTAKHSAAVKFKPDYIDADGDGNKKEPMKEAIKQAKSPTQYASPVKVEEFKDKTTTKKDKDKAAYEEKKRRAIRSGKIANWNKANPKASQEQMNAFITSLNKKK